MPPWSQRRVRSGIRIRQWHSRSRLFDAAPSAHALNLLVGGGGASKWTAPPDPKRWVLRMRVERESVMGRARPPDSRLARSRSPQLAGPVR
jgi:hypothetical protein